MSAVEVVSGHDVAAHVARAVSFVEDIVAAYSRGGVVSSSALLTTPEAAVGSAAGSGVQRVVVDILREAADNADVACAADQRATLVLGCRLTALIMRAVAAGAHRERLSGMSSSVDALRDSMTTLCRRPSMDDLVALASARDASAGRIVVDALGLAGLDGRVFVEAANVPRVEVEVRLGYCFASLKPIVASCGGGEWHATDVRVACIDGYCESIAEVDGVLSACSAAREPMMLLARGFSDEVLATIAVNNRRGTLRVAPVVATFDLESANTLRDVAAVAGGDVVSALTGQLISAVDYDALPTVAEVKCSVGGVVVVDPGATRRVEAHVASLRAGATELTAGFVADRVRALTSRTVFVRVPRGRDGLLADVDASLRRVRAAVVGGVLDVARLRALEVRDGELAQAVEAWAGCMSAGVEPIGAAVAGLVNAYAAARTIATCGAVLV